MTTGFIAPQLMSAVKTSQQNSVYVNGKWFAVIGRDLYEESTLPAIGTMGGWGDGTTDNVAKQLSVGYAGKVNEVGYDYVANRLHVFSRSSASAGVRIHTTPYTSGTDTFGATSTLRLDSTGKNYNNTGIDNGKAALITDQQGNPLLFALGSTADVGNAGNGLILGYDPYNDLHTQIEGGFDSSADRNLDCFLFNDGTNDYVGCVYTGLNSFKLAYHLTESVLANYTTGWIIEDIGTPSADSIDDHVCARAVNGTLYAVVKGGSADSCYLISSTGAIDTTTNNTAFAFTEFSDTATRPVIVLDESNEDMYIFYTDTLPPSNSIAYKKQPLTGFAFTPSELGTVAIENGSDVINNATPPAHNVTADMGSFNVFAVNTTGTAATWYTRINIPEPVAPINISPIGIASSEDFGVSSISTGTVTVSPVGISSSEAFGVATITTGSVTIRPEGIASSEAFGAATITIGLVSISPTGIPSSEAFGQASIESGILITVAGIASGEEFGRPSIGEVVSIGDYSTSVMCEIKTSQSFSSIIDANGQSIRGNL
jgi:hypothetical protein